MKKLCSAIPALLAAAMAVPVHAEPDADIQREIQQLEQREIAPGDTVAGDMADGLYQVYRLDLKETQSLLIELESERGSGLDPLIFLYELSNTPMWEPIGEDDDGGGGLNAALEQRHMVPNEYYIVVADANSGGEIGDVGAPFSLSVKRVENDPVQQIETPDETGSKFVSFRLNGNESSRELRFQGKRGARYRIDMETAGWDEGLDPRLVLVHPDGSAISDDDSGSGLDARLNLLNSDDAEYIIRAINTGEASGQFILTLTNLGTRLKMVQPVEILMDTDKCLKTVEGVFNAGTPRLETVDEITDRPYATYAIWGSKGDTVTVSMHSDDFDTFLEAGTITPTGFAVASSNDDDGREGSTNSNLELTWEADGYIHIRASSLVGHGDGENRYKLLFIQ